ncbi:MAG: hypothetical protein R3D67_01100 [Hyphomicrobiaceae bacterium]
MTITSPERVAPHHPNAANPPPRALHPHAPAGQPQATCLALALAPALILLALGLIHGPIAQPADYHAFHDARGVFGLPNALNVVTNLPFALFGAAGLLWLRGNTHGLPSHLRRCYLAMFVGIGLTAAGSAHYHWHPDNHTLVWDRLPMAIGFMGLFAGFLTERLKLSAHTSAWLLAGLLAYGIASVAYWHATGDLRPYVVAQFYPLLAIPVLLCLTPAPYTRGGDWLVALAIYVAAKVLESTDGTLYGVLAHAISGHSLKHLAAAAGAWWLYRMLRQRTPVTEAGL